MSSDPPVKSVSSTFDIIELLVDHGAMSLSAIAAEMDLPMSTVHDHLKTLRQKGYVGKQDQKYKANLRFLELGGRIRDNLDIFQVSEPELQKVANETGEHTSLMIEENDYGIYVYTAPGEHLQQIVVPIGTHSPLYASAPGKSILANMDPERREEIIERYPLKNITENTITDTERLREELQTVREREYALDHEEGMLGLQGIAKTIQSRDTGDVLGAISVYGPSGRANMEYLQGEVLKALERATNIIEHELATQSDGSS
jgi:DNA-binding IclR family transcriptional regulator